jgi:broad specificity phosphatase PhoE
MRIGLIRHFPVVEALPSGWRTAAELEAWRQRYDASPVVIGKADLGSLEWSCCVSSDLHRAVQTAKAVHRGEIEQTPLLREPDFAEFRTGGLRLPVWIWHSILALSWMTGHASQRACRDTFRRRVVAAADFLEAKPGHTLVVSHAGVMRYLSSEFRRRGFLGPQLQVADHARLYLYERK